MGAKAKARALLNVACHIVGAENVLRIEAGLRFGKKINLRNPVTLSDKICYLEYRTQDPFRAMYSDKYNVREYVISKGLGDILVPLCAGGGIYTNAEEINFSLLPDRFALKATFGCNMNLICSDKSTLDVEAARRTVQQWLTKGFNRENLEPHYKTIKKRVICEEFLENADSILDYKVHCLNGEPVFILVCSQRNKGLKLNLYDPEWNPIQGIQGPHINNKEIEKPKSLARMLEISRTLADGFDFVRVDLYEISGKVYFGELTFTPDGGMLSYFTKSFDTVTGGLLKLNEPIS